MSIIDDIQAARTQALKDKDTAKRTTLTTLAGEITNKAKIEGNREVTDQDCIKTLTKFINGAKENAGYASDMNNTQGFADAQAEIKVYESFLPAAKPQLSDEALQRIVRSVIASRLVGDGAKPKMGVVIADVKSLHEGEYDPKALAPLVKAALEETAVP